MSGQNPGPADLPSNPSHSSPERLSPESPPPHAVAGLDPGQAGSEGPAAAILRGIVNVIAVLLIIGLTYFFTISFGNRPAATTTLSEGDSAAARKIEDLRALDRKTLSSYGPVDPATQSVRIPIDRAMEIVAQEGTRPAPKMDVAPPADAPAAAPAPAAVAGASTPPPIPAPSATPVTAAPTTPAPNPANPAPAQGTPVAAAPSAPAPTPAASPVPTGTTLAVAPPTSTPTVAPARPAGGWAPIQLYRTLCITCHDADGRGNIVRKAMPAIPDLTDPKWQATRTDADLQHSILEGKGLLMLPMKDKLALVHTDLKDMVAFVRSFAGAQHVATSAPQPQPIASAQPAAASSATVPTTLPPASSTPAPGQPTVAISTPAPVSAPAPSAAPAPASAQPAVAPGALVPAGPPLLASAPLPISPAPALSLAALPTSPPGTTVPTANSEKLRIAAEFYKITCIACHGPDGRGTAIRPAMPTIPDFTAREWQTGRANAQLTATILDGKGTLMPAWRGRVSDDIVPDLIAYVRSFGPADLAANDMPASEFTNRYRELRQRWAVLQQQVSALPAP